VSESTLAVVVNGTRQALDDDARHPRFIPDRPRLRLRLLRGGPPDRGRTPPNRRRPP
jgi:hypothetical protein